MPRSSKNQIAGVRDGRLVIRVTAPPVDRAANDAVLDLLAEHLDLPRRSLAIVSGQTSRQKTIEVSGQSMERVREALVSERD